MINTDWASPLGSLPLPQPTLGGLPQQQGGSYGALPMPMAGALPQGQPAPPMGTAPAGTSPSQFAQADFMNTSAPMPTPRPAFGGAPHMFNPPMPMARPPGLTDPTPTASVPDGTGVNAGVGPEAALTSRDSGTGTGIQGFLDRLRANSKAANYQWMPRDSIFGQIGSMFDGSPTQKGDGPLSILAKSIFS